MSELRFTHESMVGQPALFTDADPEQELPGWIVKVDTLADDVWVRWEGWNNDAHYSGSQFHARFTDHGIVWVANI